MCGPMAAVMAASSIAQFAGQQQATNAYNTQAAAAHRDALVAAQNKYGDVQRKYVYDEKAINQEGYKAALKGRAEQATLKSSAGSSGIAGGSITLDNLLNASRQVSAENESRVQSRRDDLSDTFTSNVVGVRTEAEQRINSTPFKAGPNPLGLAINLASSAVMGAAGGSDAAWKMGWGDVGSKFGIGGS